MEVEIRVRRCGRCERWFGICRPCDRGHRYCGELCRHEAREESKRKARRKHQKSPEGREDHREHQRAHRERRVMDQTSREGGAKCKVEERTRSRGPAGPPLALPLCRCVVCGRRGRVGSVPGREMEIEWHQLELRYEALRRSSPEQEKRLLGSLASTGQQSTVVVVRGEGANRFVLIDGYKRVRALRRLGRDTVRASLWEIGEMDALIVAHLMKRGEPPSPLEQGWLLRELQERFGLNLNELALRFDRSPSWVSRRLSLVKQLPEEVHDQVRTGRIVAHAAMKYLVPLARANRTDCLRLLEATQPRRVSTRQMERLYTAYMSGDEKSRELVLDQPWLFLDAEQQAKSPTVETTPSEQLLDDLRLLGVVCRRCLKRAQSGLLGRLLPFEAERVHRLWQAAQVDFQALGQRWDGELTHAGPGS